MTTNAFVEAQKQLLGILAHHMIQIAERSYVLDSQKASGRILENAYRLWNGKAIFKWEIVQPDGPKEFEEISDPFPSYIPGHNTQDFVTTWMCCRPSPVNSDAASLWNSFSDTGSSDYYHQRSSSGIISTTEDLMLGRCVFCNNVLDADGLCRPCLLHDFDIPINGIPDDLGDPPKFQMGSETQTSAMTSSTPYLSEEWNRMDPPNFLVEYSGRASTPSSRPGLNNSSKTYSNPSWHDNASGASGLSMLGIESTPTLLTHEVPEFAFPLGASGDSSGELRVRDGCYLENMHSQPRHSQEVLVCVRYRMSDFQLHRKQRRPQSLVNTDELRSRTAKMVCEEVYPGDPEVHVPI